MSVPTVSEEKLAAARRMTVGENDEEREAVLRAGSAKPEAPGSTFRPFFLNSVFAGLVPPFYDFFYAVLSHYGLHALHLHPNSVLLLSIFAFYCEAFVGVMPSVALLRHFFYLRIKDGHCSGCANFVAANGTNTISKAGKKAEGFKNKWVLMDAKCSYP